MSKLYSNIDFMENENIIADVEAELWATSSNFIARLIGKILRFFAFLFGIRRRCHLIITDKRIIEIAEDIRCYCFTTNRVVRYLTPDSIKSVGYSRSATFGVCCPAYNIYYGTIKYQNCLMVKTSNEKQVRLVVDTFYKFISKA